MESRPADDRSARRAMVLVGVLALLAVVWLAFGSTLTSPFLPYDDPEYVTRNEIVREGLTWPGVRWAFTRGHASNWHPLTWLSHMLDVSLFGLDVRGHHATSLLLHAANASLVFLLLKAMTGSGGASLLVAALFAAHPTRLESVVWVSERKDVLSVLFGLLAMMAWTGWVRSPRRRLLSLAVVLHAASLMAKPMLVTLPFLLLLLDFWPFRRMQGRGNFGPLVREKWPFFALSTVSAAVTILVQHSGGAVKGLESFPLAQRLANAPIAVGTYLVDFFWPGPRAIFYPHPGPDVSWPAALVVGAGLAVVTVATTVWRTRRPCVFVGWAWFLVALLPVVGILQVGAQARADRYTYLPYLGLLVAVVFGLQAAARRWGVPSGAVGAAALALVAASVLATRAQSAPWENPRALFEHARQVTGPNHVAEHALGSLDLDAGRLESAERHLRSALDLAPTFGRARLALARVQVLSGRIEEAAASYEAILDRTPDYIEALNNLAACRLWMGELEPAREMFSRAVSANPRLAASTHVLGMLEAALGRPEDAVTRLTEAVGLAPENASWALDLEGARDLARGVESAASQRFRGRLGAYHREAAGALEARDRREEARAHMIEAERIERAAPRVESKPGSTKPMNGAPR